MLSRALVWSSTMVWANLRTPSFLEMSSATLAVAISSICACAICLSMAWSARLRVAGLAPARVAGVVVVAGGAGVAGVAWLGGVAGVVAAPAWPVAALPALPVLPLVPLLPLVLCGSVLWPLPAWANTAAVAMEHSSVMMKVMSRMVDLL